MALLYLGAGADVATMFHNDLITEGRHVIMVDARPDEGERLSSEITRQLRMFKLIGATHEPNEHDDDTYGWRLIDGGTLTLVANTPDEALEERIALSDIDAVVVHRHAPAERVFESLPHLATVHATPTGVDAVPTDFLGLVELLEEGVLDSEDEWLSCEEEVVAEIKICGQQGDLPEPAHA
jgi:hypothetical protein